MKHYDQLEKQTTASYSQTTACQWNRAPLVGPPSKVLWCSNICHSRILWECTQLIEWYRTFVLSTYNRRGLLNTPLDPRWRESTSSLHRSTPRAPSWASQYPGRREFCRQWDAFRWQRARSWFPGKLEYMRLQLETSARSHPLLNYQNARALMQSDGDAASIVLHHAM